MNNVVAGLVKGIAAAGASTAALVVIEKIEKQVNKRSAKKKGEN